MSGTSADEYHPGLEGVIASETAIANIEGKDGAGGLEYRGYRIEDLAGHVSYEQTAFLLLHGDLPNRDQLGEFDARLRRSRLRANPLPVNIFAWAVIAGALSIVAQAGWWMLVSRFENVSGSVLPDLSQYPWLTTTLAVVMGSIVSPILEQAGFWGYCQSMLERKFQVGLPTQPQSVGTGLCHRTDATGTRCCHISQCCTIASTSGIPACTRLTADTRTAPGSARCACIDSSTPWCGYGRSKSEPLRSTATRLRATSPDFAPRVRAFRVALSSCCEVQ